jgi:hypothetical protein
MQKGVRSVQSSNRWMLPVCGVLLLVLAAGEASGQGGPGFGRGRGFRGGRGGGPGGPGGPDERFAQDRNDFHYLLEHHTEIRRTVTNRPDGVQTLTESDNPEVAAKIQEHVDSMHDRIKNRLPIHMRDPLFAAVFGHADKIKMQWEATDKGVRVVETSDDPYVARLIQAHAQVVNLFVKNGFGEPHKNHAVPPRDNETTPAAAAENQSRE